MNRVTVTKEQPKPYPWVVAVVIDDEHRRVVYGAKTKREAEQVAAAIRYALEAVR